MKSEEMSITLLERNEYETHAYKDSVFCFFLISYNIILNGNQERML